MPNDDPSTSSGENFLPKEPLDSSSPAQPQVQANNTNQVRTLLSWSAPGRPFHKRSKEYYLTSLLIVIFVEVILFLFSQYLLMVVVLSLVFVSFALATVAPKDFHYRLSTEGVTVEDHFYLWQELYDFYFKKRGNTQVLHLRTHAFIPGELTITLGDMDKEHVKTVLLPYLPYREVIKPTFTEKSGDWLARNFPLERS
ncbi:MAG: hypothetical protein HYU48_00710 [Candidatus Levybacteria bacterium]|nr:hypothetical protein [Candidatus Levybacteria bacterium]